jgi:hypothetical protein
MPDESAADAARSGTSRADAHTRAQFNGDIATPRGMIGRGTDSTRSRRAWMSSPRLATTDQTD